MHVTSSLFLFSLFLPYALSVKLPLRRRSISSGLPIRSSKSNSVKLNDVNDTVYSVDINLGGRDFAVVLDTGSSDLWVYTGGSGIKFTNATNLTTGEGYAKGGASGPIAFAEFQMGPYHVPSQAFLNASGGPDTDEILDLGLYGILGMSFADGEDSPISGTVQAAYGKDSLLGLPPISNIFAQNPGQPNCFDIALGRKYISDGIFFIGEHDPEHQDIVSQPKLYKQVKGRWTVVLDRITTNGVAVELGPSSISGIAPGKLGAVLDTGYTQPPIPRAAVDAIYGNIPGAVNITSVASFLGPDIASSGATWALPCNSTGNLSFTLGGIDYPIHPRDLITNSTVSLPIGPGGTATDTTICTNLFVANTLDPASFPGMDLILGQPFLRNVYASFNMGTADGSGNSSFIQLLSTTDPASANAEFDAVWTTISYFTPPTIDSDALQKLIDSGALQKQNVSNPGAAPVAATGALAEDDDSAPHDGQLTSLVRKWSPIVVGLLGANVGVGVILCVIGLLMFLRSRTSIKGRSINPNYAPVRFKETISTAEEE